MSEAETEIRAPKTEMDTINDPAFLDAVREKVQSGLAALEGAGISTHQFSFNVDEIPVSFEESGTDAVLKVGEGRMLYELRLPGRWIKG